MSESDVTLKVLEAYTRDVGRGVARIDYEAMDVLDASTGDIIEIRGKRNTVAKCLPLYPSDEGRGVIRIDGLIRNNSGVAISDTVTIKKIKAPPAEKVIVAPLESIPPIDERYLADALESVPVTKGDNIMIPYFGGRLTFQIVGVTPTSDAVLITQRTVFSISEKGESAKGVSPVNYEDIGGLRNEIRKVREMIELPLRHPEIFEKLGVKAPKGILLYGPPGTGKTLLAKAVAYESSAHFISISGPEIMSKFYGESEARLREIFKEAKEKAPSIIFIDEIDSIAPKREEVTGEVERRVVSQLLSLMDGLEGRGEVIIVAATNRPNAIDPALRRPGRFDREIEIKVPDKIGREEILAIHSREMPLDEDVDIEELASKTHGYVGADLEGLCKEGAMKTLRRLLPDMKFDEEKISPEFLDKITIIRDDFNQALRDITPSALREVYIETPDVDWSDIGGLDNIRKEIQEAVEWPLKYPDAYEKIGYSMPKGIMLHGPSGTGKTLIAKAVAKESGANFISVRGPELLSKWVGESERGIREVFRRARQASPCVIFFDELDSIAPLRGASGDSQVSERVVSQLLTELDGIQSLDSVLVLAATNRIDMIDPALIRSGRFDKLLYIEKPGKDERAKILKIHTKGKLLSKEPGNEVNLSKIAEMTEGFSGADLASVVNTAVSSVLQNFVSKYNPEEAKEILEADSLIYDAEQIKADIKDKITEKQISQIDDLSMKLKSSLDSIVLGVGNVATDALILRKDELAIKEDELKEMSSSRNLIHERSDDLRKVLKEINVKYKKFMKSGSEQTSSRIKEAIVKMEDFETAIRKVKTSRDGRPVEKSQIAHYK